MSTGAAIANRWEHFSHQADIGVRGIGPTKEAAFEQAALALTGVMCDPRAVRDDEHVDIMCSSGDDEMLLVAWLNTIIYEIATRRMLFGRFTVSIAENTLRAMIWGEKIDVARHQPAVEIKGATCTELSVRQTAGGEWIAQCVVDV